MPFSGDCLAVFQCFSSGFIGIVCLKFCSELLVMVYMTFVLVVLDSRSFEGFLLYMLDIFPGDVFFSYGLLGRMDVVFYSAHLGFAAELG